MTDLTGPTPSEPRTEPRWLAPLLDDLLDSGPGTVGHGRIDSTRFDDGEPPSKLLAASSVGVVHVTFDMNSCETTPDVDFIPWSSITRIRVYRSAITVHYVGGANARAVVEVKDADGEEEGAAARRFARGLIRLMTANRR